MHPAQRIILMEGADGVGKTEIGKGIAIELDIPYFRMSSQHEHWRKGKFKEALEFDQTYLTELLLQTGHSMVIDRGWVSEWVYSKVYGRDTNQSILERLDWEWSALGAWIIIPLRRSFEGVRGDDLVVPEKLQAIQDGYLDFIAWTDCNVLSLYVDEPGVDCSLARELQLIIPEIEEQNRYERYSQTKISFGKEK